MTSQNQIFLIVWVLSVTNNVVKCFNTIHCIFFKSIQISFPTALA
ncbi:unnamed protein product [Schistosoma mattheei]|uniref:Uncharacterized protein n=1 Tax=Schistosoma mattheei TaxID=31246 RepID=A0A183P5V4_9TREM|nr:unnamed protein product [Schistosoma mattheei]